MGPTAGGKSAWALREAQKQSGVIVNADSRQFYQGLRIGSAAPSDEETARVRHELYHVLSYPKMATAGWFYREAMRCLAKLESEGVTRVYVVGGSHFYFQALEHGLYDIPGASPEVRRYLQEKKDKEGPEALYRDLLQRDPEWAKKLHPNDMYRITRALEVLLTTGRPMSEWAKEHEARKKNFPWAYEKIVVLPESEEEHKKRIAQRTQKMLQSGWIEEVQGLLKQGYGDWQALTKAVGYREVLAYLRGELQGLEELSQAINRATWALVRKQKTWLKARP
jgi:tRNA dimethylallyltransferase